MSISKLSLTVNDLHISATETSADAYSAYVSLNSVLIDVVKIGAGGKAVAFEFVAPTDQVQIFFKNDDRNEVIGSVSVHANQFKSAPSATFS